MRNNERFFTKKSQFGPVGDPRTQVYVQSFKSSGPYQFPESLFKKKADVQINLNLVGCAPHAPLCPKCQKLFKTPATGRKILGFLFFIHLYCLVRSRRDIETGHIINTWLVCVLQAISRISISTELSCSSILLTLHYTYTKSPACKSCNGAHYYLS